MRIWNKLAAEIILPTSPGDQSPASKLKDAEASWEAELMGGLQLALALRPVIDDRDISHEYPMLHFEVKKG